MNAALYRLLTADTGPADRGAVVDAAQEAASLILRRLRGHPPEAVLAVGRAMEDVLRDELVPPPATLPQLRLSAP